MTKSYKLKGGSKAKEARDEQKGETAKELQLGPYTGGAIANRMQLVRGLRAKLQAEKLLKEFGAAAKAYVDEHGPVEDDGQTWGPSEQQRETKCSLSLEGMDLLLEDIGINNLNRKQIEKALKRRGVGEIKRTKVYRWSR